MKIGKLCINMKLVFQNSTGSEFVSLIMLRDEVVKKFKLTKLSVRELGDNIAKANKVSTENSEVYKELMQHCKQVRPIVKMVNIDAAREIINEYNPVEHIKVKKRKNTTPEENKAQKRS